MLNVAKWYIWWNFVLQLNIIGVRLSVLYHWSLQNGVSSEIIIIKKTLLNNVKVHVVSLYVGCRSIFQLRVIVPKGFRRVIFPKKIILKSCYSEKVLSRRVVIPKLLLVIKMFGIITLRKNKEPFEIKPFRIMTVRNIELSPTHAITLINFGNIIFYLVW